MHSVTREYISIITTRYYEVRFDLTDTLFCLTKYELVRTTKFTRLVLPILYVKRLVVVN